ncbi:hypothetical protein VPH35_123223 [Triticum aestivum]
MRVTHRAPHLHLAAPLPGHRSAILPTPPLPPCSWPKPMTPRLSSLDRCCAPPMRDTSPMRCCRAVDDHERPSSTSPSAATRDATHSGSPAVANFLLLPPRPSPPAAASFFHALRTWPFLDEESRSPLLSCLDLLGCWCFLRGYSHPSSH